MAEYLEAEDFEDDDIPIISGRGEGIMEETPATGSGAGRRNEDIALDLMKFVAMTTGCGRPRRAWDFKAQARPPSRKSTPTGCWSCTGSV